MGLKLIYVCTMNKFNKIFSDYSFELYKIESSRESILNNGREKTNLCLNIFKKLSYEGCLMEEETFE